MTERDRGVGLTIAATERPCRIHKTHKPTPVSSELHHRFPKYLQIAVWGEVRERDIVPLCGTGHSDVHFAIDALLRGKKLPKGVGRTERELAEFAVARYREEYGK